MYRLIQSACGLQIGQHVILYTNDNNGNGNDNNNNDNYNNNSNNNNNNDKRLY